MAEITRRELILVLAAVPSLACPKPDHLIRLAGLDLSGLDLRGLNLAYADLTGANLRGCDLTDARLTDADLSGADLSDAVLRGIWAEGATFIDALLTGADFRRSERDLYFGTHLMGADFEGADLTGADLCEADLGGANLRQATLKGADLRGARMDAKTILNGACFDSEALENVSWAEVALVRVADAQPASEHSDRELDDATAGTSLKFAVKSAGRRMPLFPGPVTPEAAEPIGPARTVQTRAA